MVPLGLEELMHGAWGLPAQTRGWSAHRGAGAAGGRLCHTSSPAPAPVGPVSGYEGPATVSQQVGRLLQAVTWTGIVLLMESDLSSF